MSTFDFDTYPVTSDTGTNHRHVVIRETMDDGSPVVRSLTANEYAVTTLVFSPLSQADSVSLLAYLHANRSTEIDFGAFGTGYIWSDPAVQNIGGLRLRVVTVDIYTRLG